VRSFLPLLLFLLSFFLSLSLSLPPSLSDLSLHSFLHSPVLLSDLSSRSFNQQSSNLTHSHKHHGLQAKSQRSSNPSPGRSSLRLLCMRLCSAIGPDQDTTPTATASPPCFYQGRRPVWSYDCSLGEVSILWFSPSSCCRREVSL